MLTPKSIIDYITYLLPFRKTKWGLIVILLPILVVWILHVFPLYKPEINQFKLWSYSLLCTSLILIVIWLFHSKRIILGNKNYIVVLSLKATDPRSNTYIQTAISMLKTELDRLGLSGKFKILMAGPDIVNTIEGAHKYREHFDIDLLIWGEVFSGKKDEKELCDFKRLFFTYKIPPQVILSDLTNLFKSDINIALVNRDWNVYEFNSLPDLEKISTNLGEVIMFVLGVIYCQSKDYAEDSIAILENLFKVLSDRTQNEKVTVSPENNTLTMSSGVFRKGRVLSILLNAYKNLGLHLNERRNYSKARFYLEKHLSYEKGNIPVLGGLALCFFFLGDYEAAKKHTEEIGKIDKHNQIYLINRAFFGIWEKNYPSALHFYKEFIKRERKITKDVVVSVISFLDQRKGNDSKEIAYDFAIGLLDYHFIQKTTGEKELRKFLKLSQGKQEYKEMIDFLQNDLLKGRKEKKRRNKK